jgi:hypothetical protein
MPCAAGYAPAWHNEYSTVYAQFSIIKFSRAAVATQPTATRKAATDGCLALWLMPVSKFTSGNPSYTAAVRPCKPQCMHVRSEMLSSTQKSACHGVM